MELRLFGRSIIESGEVTSSERAEASKALVSCYNFICDNCLYY